MTLGEAIIVSIVIVFGVMWGVALSTEEPK